MKNLFKLFGIIVLVAVIGFSLAACSGSSGSDSDDDKDGSKGGVNWEWRMSKRKFYTVTDGAASLSSEDVYNYITYRYTSDTNYEQKYTVTITRYVPTTTTSSTTQHNTRNGQTLVSTSESATETSTSTVTYDPVNVKTVISRVGTTTTNTGTSTYNITYDPATDLTLNSKHTNTTTSGSGTTTTNWEYTYAIQLLSDSGGVKTYKHYVTAYTRDNVSQNVSNREYQEYKIQNGKKLEAKYFDADGVLQTTYIYYEIYSDDPVIRAKLGSYGVIGSATSTENASWTFEVVSDSATELVIRDKYFSNNVLKSYIDETYEKVN